MARLLTASFMLLCSSTVFAKQDMIPEEFHGRWDIDRKACGTSDAGLTVSRNRLDFHESTGKVKSVSILGKGVIEVDMSFSGEGETWIEALRFKLSADGMTLTDITEGDVFARVRCPSK